MLWQRAKIVKGEIPARIGREVWVLVEDSDGNKIHRLLSVNYLGKFEASLPVNIIQQGNCRCSIPPDSVEMMSGPDDFREFVEDVVYENSIWYQEMLDWQKKRS